MKITMIMMQSLNGKISKDSKDNLMWGGKADKQFFARETKKLGLMIMGSNTFKSMRERVLPGRRTIVFTSNPEQFKHIVNEDFSTWSSTPEELVKQLRSEGLTQAALVGGAKLNYSFLKSGLITSFIISTTPMLITQGVDLFPDSDDFRQKLSLTESLILEGGTVVNKYELLK